MQTTLPVAMIATPVILRTRRACLLTQLCPPDRVTGSQAPPTKPRHQVICIRRYSKQVLDYYHVLGLTPNAPQTAVKAAYYRLSKQYHPDVNKEPEAKVRFANIAEAYETLGNKAKRRAYDRSFAGGATFTGTSGIDVEYSEFLRKRGQFGGKGAAPTGRTNIYDFDEFYRVHYGEAIKQKQADKAAVEEMEMAKAERKVKHKRHVILLGTLLFGFVSYSLYEKFA